MAAPVWSVTAEHNIMYNINGRSGVYNILYIQHGWQISDWTNIIKRLWVRLDLVSRRSKKTHQTVKKQLDSS